MASTSVLFSSLLFMLGIAGFTAPIAAQGRINTHGYAASYPGALALSFTTGPTWLSASAGPTTACDCEFDEGKGMGFNAGIALDIFLNRNLSLRLQGLFDNHSTVFTKTFNKTLYAEDGASVPVTTERRFEADLRYASFSMHMLWFPGAGNFFASLGAGAGFYLGGTAKDMETLTTAGVFYSHGSNQVLYHDGDLSELAEASLRAVLVLGVGYDLPLARGVALAPEVQLEYPLSSVTSQDDRWKQIALRSNLALRIGI
jgi:hypothetical protein